MMKKIKQIPMIDGKTLKKIMNRYIYQEQTVEQKRVAGTQAWGRVWEVIDAQDDLFVAFCPEEADAVKITMALNEGSKEKS